MIVVSDTSPINYLVLVEQIDRLYDLYRRLIIPTSARDELQAAETPRVVQVWLEHQPSWLEVASLSKAPLPELAYLGAGERDAIALAKELGAHRLLIDDREPQRGDPPRVAGSRYSRGSGRRRRKGLAETAPSD